MGIPEREFWSILPREFKRRAKVFREEMRAKQDVEKYRHFSRLNAAGLAFNGKNWKWIDPDGRSVPEDFEERERAALARHNARRKKKHGLQSRK